MNTKLNYDPATFHLTSIVVRRPNKAAWPRPWRKWNGNYQKIYYDIITTWGKTHIGCWPNAGKMNTMDGTGKSFTPEKVRSVRRSIKEEPADIEKK